MFLMFLRYENKSKFSFKVIYCNNFPRDTFGERDIDSTVEAIRAVTTLLQVCFVAL